MAQMTAVQDLINELKKFMLIDGVDPDTIDAAIEFAANRLEMERQQTIYAYEHGQKNECSHILVGKLRITGEEYFEQTYKTQAQ